MFLYLFDNLEGSLLMPFGAPYSVTFAAFGITVWFFFTATVQALASKGQLLEFTSQFVIFQGVPKQSLLGHI